MKIRPMGAELLHVDGQTDRMKLIVTFRDFANAPKNLKGKTTWQVWPKTGRYHYKTGNVCIK